MNRGLRNELTQIAGLAAIVLWMRRHPFWAVLLGLCAIRLQFARSIPYALENRVALISGGSRGLGLALAEALLREGAKVVLLARDADELERAQIKLAESFPEGVVLTIRCDVSRFSELVHAFSVVEERFGRLDLLVNNAGSISVGPFETMEDADFEAQLNLQVYAVIHAVRMALPLFRRQGGGRILNIASIAAALPVPHMSAYCTAKSALAGLSETLAAELALENIQVTTAYPGLMRTGSPIQAVFKGNHQKEYGWFAAGDVMPGISIDAEGAARKMIQAVRDGDVHVRFPMVTPIGIVGHAMFREVYAALARVAAAFMPKGRSHIRKTGAQSQAWLEEQLWYRPLQSREAVAEKRFNQVEKFDADFNLGIHTGGSGGNGMTGQKATL